MNTMIPAMSRVFGIHLLLVCYHKSRLASALDAMKQRGTETCMPVSCSWAFQRHQRALRRLGFLVEKEFALRRCPISGPDGYLSFCQLLRARFPDGLWACAAKGTRVVLTLPESQLREWEQFFIEYDR
jgi:hypothetical protein